MKKQLLLALTALLLGTSCGTDTPANTDIENPGDVLAKVYSTANLEAQSFTISNNTDNIVTGANGTIVRVFKNTFVDQDGAPIIGDIEIKLIEALSPMDWVLGNLTTTFENKPLETGGMIYLDAVSGSKQLAIASGKQVFVRMPADSALANMSVFEGQKDSSGIQWVNPVVLPGPGKRAGIAFQKGTFQKTTNVRYSVDGFRNGNNPPNVDEEVGRIAWEGDGLKIAKDSTLEIHGHTVHFYKYKELLTYEETFYTAQGVNTYALDPNASYIFSMQKLGWANIDRLLQDPRTSQVELTTSIQNQSEFKYVHVTMITQQMYLPGYQKKDGSYSFAHDDNEIQALPVGESATILATAYKNGKPYFGFKKIEIEKQQIVAFRLEESTKEKLKAELGKII